jgi:hypothetical protein
MLVRFQLCILPRTHSFMYWLYLYGINIQMNTILHCYRRWWLDMSGTSHFWSRSRWEKNFVPVPVPAKKKFWSRQEKVLGLGLGPFRHKLWCRSQSKIFWSRSWSKKNILVPVLFRKNFGAGPSQKKFSSRSRSKKEIWSRWDRDHFAHL